MLASDIFGRFAAVVCLGIVLSTVAQQVSAQVATPAEKPAPGDQLPPEQAGVGAALRIEGDRVLINKILPDTPAAASGVLQPNDQLLAVAEKDAEPVEVTGMKMAAVVGLIRGPAGTVVRLTVLSVGKGPDGIKVVSLVRNKIAAIEKFVDGRLLPVGEQAPDFSFTSLSGEAIASEATSLTQLKSRIVVVEFWATWCGPCIQSVDRLQGVAADHPEWQGQVELLMVSVDDEVGDAARLAAEKKWSNLRVVWAGPEILKTYRIGGLPEVFVLDREGKVVAAGSPKPIAELIAPLLDNVAGE